LTGRGRGLRGSIRLRPALREASRSQYHCDRQNQQDGRTNSVTVRRKRILMIFKFASFPVPDPAFDDSIRLSRFDDCRAYTLAAFLCFVKS